MGFKCFFGYHNIKRKEKREFCKCLECVKKKMKYLTSLDIEEKCVDCGKLVRSFSKSTPTGY